MQELTKFEPVQITAANTIDLYLERLDATEKTRETYRRSLRSWTRFLDSRQLSLLEANRETVLEYKEELKSSKSSATVNAYLTAVRKLYEWLEAMRVYPNIAADVKGLRRNPNSPKDALTREQAQALLSRNRETLEELRNYAMLSLMLRRGLRTVEVVRANVEDIRQLSGEAVLYVQGKGYSNKAEFVILNQPCLKAIYEYLDAREAQEGKLEQGAPLFAGTGNRNRGGRMTTRSVSRIASDAFKAEGISSANLTAHSLRHTAVTFALMGGATVQEAQAMARHASINTTMIYAHNLERMAAGAEHRVDAYLEEA